MTTSRISRTPEAARAWLERLLETEPDVRIGLAALLAFIRIRTDPRVYAQPRTPAEAIGIAQGLLAAPTSRSHRPAAATGRTWRIWRLLAAPAGRS